MFSPPWSKPTRVALFGTSADPPHLGHRGILDWLSEAFDHVAVWAAENPYKPKQSPLGDRAQMLRLLIETLPNQDRVGVYQSLSDRYTIHSIARAQQLWPKAKFTFVVGADLIAQIPNWYEADQIFAKADILVFPRPGHPIEGAALEALQQKAQVAIAHPPQQHNIASSHYRQNACDEDEAGNDLPSVIRDYITEHNLYPCLQTPQARPQEQYQEKYPARSHSQPYPKATLQTRR